MCELKEYLLGDFRDDEFRKTKSILSNIDRDFKVLDVGCGYGKKIKLLNSLGFKYVLGVDINKEVVLKNRENGLNVISIESFNDNNEIFDLIVMSHIIEHFQYEELKLFMEYYLTRLKQGGYLLILTPMLDSTFYTNFDHVKPYLPDGISAVFEDDKAQVQFYSPERLKLVDIYFRRAPFSIKFFRSYYIGKQNIFLKLSNILLLLLFNLSGRIFGRTNGWLGLYQKC